MATVLTDESNYEDIADAIREKNGSSDTYLPSEMAEAVRNIPTGGAVQSVNGKTGAVVLDASDVGAGTYSKPSGGIPASDLASSVQTSLGKADTALQAAPVTSVNGKTGAVVLDAEDVGAGTYSKPSGGIPKADLASGVQTSLGKADTALQMAPVTSVNGKTGAVNITPADIGAKAVQTAVNDPSSSGSATTMAFISNITQNAQGVVSPTKKTIPPATTSADGIMTSQNVITMLAAYGMGNAAEYSFAPSSRHEATYPIKAGSIFTHGGSASYGEWLYRALVDIANANQISSATAEQIRVSDLYNELLASILAAYPMDSAEGRMASFSDGAAGLPLKALTVGIVPVQAGSGTPSPTNIRAISGVTAAAVTRCGKNLLNPADAEIGRAWNGSSASNRARLVVPCMPNTTYTISATGVSTLSNIYVTNTASVPASSAGAEITSRMPFTMTTRSDAQYIVVAFSKDSIAQEDIEALNLQLELGSAATEYEPYSGDNYDIAFPSEAGTVYGGSLDVINGILTVNFGVLSSTFGELAEGSGTAPSGYALKNLRLSENFPADAWLNDTVCNIATPSSTSNAENVVRFSIDKTFCIFTLPSNLDSSTPVMVAYPLASPRTYQVDPALISTLLGKNTVYADTGSVSLTYRADPTLAAFVQDVQINGNSIANNGVANVPIASSSSPGVVKVGSGLQVGSSNELKTNPATLANIKAGTDANKPLAPSVQHAAAFYGLAKAAGSDMASSSNPVGAYTDEAKVAIQKMLGIYQPPWELLNDITLTEEDNISLVADDNGTPYDLLRVFIIIEYPANTPTASSGYGRYTLTDNNGNTISSESSKYTTSSNVSNKFFYTERIGTMVLLEYTARTDQSSNGTQLKFRYNGINFNFGNIQQISTPSADVEPAGTRIKIYGQRAY